MKTFLTHKKLVAFDLDGTLIDSMPWYADAATDLMVKNYGLSAEQARRDYYQTSGIPFFKQLEVLFPQDEKNHSVAEAFEQRKSDFIAHEGFPFSEEVQTALAAMQKLGLKIAVSTSNSPQNLEISASRWPLQFDAVLGYQGENFQKGKSHFIWLANHFNLQLTEILFIGDSLDDYWLSKDTGVDFVAILGSFTTNDFYQANQNIKCIQHLSELLM